jgi:hypothetical protein
MVFLPSRDRPAKTEKPHLVPHILPVLWCAKLHQHRLDLEFRTSSKGMVGLLVRPSVETNS